MIFSELIYLFDGYTRRRVGWCDQLKFRRHVCSYISMKAGEITGWWCRRYKVKDVGRGYRKNGFCTRRMTGIAGHLAASASRMTYGPIPNSRNCHLKLILIPRVSTKCLVHLFIREFPCQHQHQSLFSTPFSAKHVSPEDIVIRQLN